MIGIMEKMQTLMTKYPDLYAYISSSNLVLIFFKSFNNCSEYPPNSSYFTITNFEELDCLTAAAVVQNKQIILVTYVYNIAVNNGFVHLIKLKNKK